MELKVGDRVRYIHEDAEDIKRWGWYPPIGTMGTIRTVSPHPNGKVLIEVTWDYGVRGVDQTWWCLTTDVEKVDEEIIRHIQLTNADKIEYIDEENSMSYQLAHKIRIAAAKDFDEACIKVCVDYAKSEGYDDLYLINGEFIKTAIENEIKRRKEDGKGN